MNIPLASGFAGYKKTTLKSDFLAALVVTAIAVPESLGFAALLGLPLQTGLYCAFVAPIVFALFTSSKRIIVGADSATVTLVAAAASTIAAVGSQKYADAVIVLSILTGLALFALAAARFGFLVNFISKPVLVGFLSGVGLQLMLSKLPDMAGIAASGTTLERLGHAITHYHSASLFTIGLSVFVLLAMYLAKRTRVPGPLAGLAAGTLLSIVAGLGDLGVKLVGDIPAGLPSYVLPHMTLPLVVALIPAAFSIAFVIIVQGITVIRDTGTQHGEKTNINQDIFAFGSANIISALTGGFAINGSPPRTLAAEMAGGKSPMVNVFMGIFVGAILLFATDLFKYIPVAVLAVIVFVIGFHLVQVSKLKHIYKTRRTEFIIAMIALGGVVLFDVQQGVFVAVVVSLIERLHRQYQPGDQVLLRDGKLSDWARERIDLDYQNSAAADGLLIYSFNGSLFFDNVRYFSHRLRQAIHGAKKPVYSVIVDAGAIDEIDYTAVDTLRTLYLQLRDDNIRLVLAHVTPHLRRQLGEFGVTHIMGPHNIYDTLSQALHAHTNAKRDALSLLPELKTFGLSPRRYVVIGGAAMATYGLRATNDVDLVVSNSLYTHLRDRMGWNEFVQENGKCILSYKGFHATPHWVGFTLHTLSKDAITIDGIRYISPAAMIAGKQRLNRQKDKEDIRLLKRYLRAHPPKTGNISYGT